MEEGYANVLEQCRNVEKRYYKRRIVKEQFRKGVQQERQEK